MLVCLMVLGGSIVTMAAQASDPPIIQVEYNTLTCDGLVDFDDLPQVGAPGLNFDTIFESGNADFAERFKGQTLSFSGDFDVLSGNPTDPLTLQAGDPNDNINVFFRPVNNSNVMTGLGPLGFPNFNSIGEGSFAVLFDFDQSEFGFELVGGNNGTATVNFFKRDGALIQTIVVSTPSPAGTLFGFKRAGGIKDIAGISIHNNDAGGIGFDNLCHDVPGVPGPGVKIEKELLYGPEEIGIYLPEPTQYRFEVAYSGPAALVEDTVPAEFEILELIPSNGTALFFETSKGKGNSANRIQWNVPEGSNTLTVWIQTVASPGKGHTVSVFKPTSCGPLPINDGATAFEVDPEAGEVVLVEVVDPETGEITLQRVVIVGPSNSLEVEAVAGAKPCEEAEQIELQATATELDPLSP